MGSAHAFLHPFVVPSIPSIGRVPLPINSTNLDKETAEDVTFSIESGNRQPAELETRDNSGFGRNAEKLDREFDAFYSTKPRGLGIGRFICPSIIEAPEVRLWASLNEPHGATFQFTLPPVFLRQVPGAARLEGHLEASAAGESA